MYSVNINLHKETILILQIYIFPKTFSNSFMVSITSLGHFKTYSYPTVSVQQWLCESLLWQFLFSPELIVLHLIGVFDCG